MVWCDNPALYVDCVNGVDSGDCGGRSHACASPAYVFDYRMPTAHNLTVYLMNPVCVLNATINLYARHATLSAVPELGVVKARLRCTSDIAIRAFNVTHGSLRLSGIHISDCTSGDENGGAAVLLLN